MNDIDESFIRIDSTVLRRTSIHDMSFILISSTLAAAAVVILLKLHGTRNIDVTSFILKYVIVPSKIFIILTKLRVTELLRPKSVVRVKTANNFVFTTIPYNLTLSNRILEFEVRDSDVFVVTYPKSGTTWMQEIVWLICHNADIEASKQLALSTRSPYLESVDVGEHLGFQALENWPTDSIRIMKVHRPHEILPHGVSVEKRGRIIYVARNPKDVCVSYFHFHDMTFSLPKAGTWDEFLTKFSNGDVSVGDWFDFTLKYWKESQENPDKIYFTTYEALSQDLPAQVRALAKFLGKDLRDEQVEAIASHCTFASMKENRSVNYEKMADIAAFDFSKTKFMRKGRVGDWKNYFTVNQTAAFDELFERRMKGAGLNMQFEI